MLLKQPLLFIAVMMQSVAVIGQRDEDLIYLNPDPANKEITVLLDSLELAIQTELASGNSIIYEQLPAWDKMVNGYPSIFLDSISDSDGNTRFVVKENNPLTDSNGDALIVPCDGSYGGFECFVYPGVAELKWRKLRMSDTIGFRTARVEFNRWTIVAMRLPVPEGSKQYWVDMEKWQKDHPELLDEVWWQRLCLEIRKLEYLPYIEENK